MKSKTTPRLIKHDFLFSSLMRCRECGGTISWEIQKGQTYGHCNHYKPCSHRKWAIQEEVEEQIIQALSGLELKSHRLKDWIIRALKETHKDEIEFHNSSVGELQKRQVVLKHRLNGIYEDKLDGKITESSYESRFYEYSREIKEIDTYLSSHNSASISNLELGINLFNLSQEVSSLYHKGQIDEKRALIKSVFMEITLFNKKIEFTPSPTFKILQKAVDLTNSSKELKSIADTVKTFELQKKTDESVFEEGYLQARPILLPVWDFIRTIV